LLRWLESRRHHPVIAGHPGHRWWGEGRRRGPGFMVAAPVERARAGRLGLRTTGHRLT
jgi:hypothetical protein